MNLDVEASGGCVSTLERGNDFERKGRTESGPAFLSKLIMDLFNMLYNQAVCRLFITHIADPANNSDMIIMPHSESVGIPVG
jgi:hypothetical protein